MTVLRSWSFGHTVIRPPMRQKGAIYPENASVHP
jgi:hypothetical protein